jgi:NAD(P)-dependent dehydrogenase (short-subunit alcohol dehydrogenase family)
LGSESLDPLATFRLDGKVAIVTGATSRLSARFARVLDAAGAKLVLVARRRARLEQLAGELTGPLPVPCDLSRPAGVARAVESPLERYARVDVLVNNAGIVDVQRAEDEPLERFRETINVNLIAPFALAQRAARAMLQSSRGGTIVNIASVLGVVGGGQVPQAGCAASKGGLVNLTRELSAQWAGKGFSVNTIAPGWLESEMTADMLSSDRGKDWVARRAPLGRHGREGSWTARSCSSSARPAATPRATCSQSTAGGRRSETRAITPSHTHGEAA